MREACSRKVDVKNNFIDLWDTPLQWEACAGLFIVKKDSQGLGVCGRRLPNSQGFLRNVKGNHKAFLSGVGLLGHGARVNLMGMLESVAGFRQQPLIPGGQQKQQLR